MIIENNDIPLQLTILLNIFVNTTVMNQQKENDNPTTEARILAAAEKEFLTKGFAGARTTSIAEAAGVNHALLHYYFGTKQSLFEKIVEDKMETLLRIMFMSLGDPEIPLFNKLKTAIGEHFDFVAANPDFPRFMLAEVFNRPELLSRVIGVMKNNVSSIHDSLQKQINEYAERHLCQPVKASDIILDIISLNIFSFMAAPAIIPLLGVDKDDIERFYESRKKENIETIMRRLRP